MKDDEKDQYSKLSPTHQYGYMAARRRHFKPGAPMQYSNGVEKDRYARVELENKTLRGEVQALRVDRTYRERYSKLQELGQIHEFDIQVEADECKAMTDADFEKHCNRIVSRYSRRDPNGGMPTLHLEPLEREASVEEAKVERYSNRAVQIATQSGGKMSWNEALEAAKLELK
jgi:hypothetical protein